MLSFVARPGEVQMIYRLHHRLVDRAHQSFSCLVCSECTKCGSHSEWRSSESEVDNAQPPGLSQRHPVNLFDVCASHDADSLFFTHCY